MRIRSVNVGRPRDVEWKGRVLRTAIFKHPVDGPVTLRRLNLDGDEQADLTVHGGPDKAVYAYPSEHDAWWAEQLGGAGPGPGAFGENLSTEGLLEDEVRVGDRFRMGSAELVVTQPRQPCLKLAIRFGRADMVKRFERSGRPGFYLRVLREGRVCAGDSIERLGGPGEGPSVRELARLVREESPDPELLRRALAMPDLAAEWRDDFRRRLARRGP